MKEFPGAVSPFGCWGTSLCRPGKRGLAQLVLHWSCGRGLHPTCAETTFPCLARGSSQPRKGGCTSPLGGGQRGGEARLPGHSSLLQTHWLFRQMLLGREARVMGGSANAGLPEWI